MATTRGDGVASRIMKALRRTEWERDWSAREMPGRNFSEGFFLAKSSAAFTTAGSLCSRYPCIFSGKALPASASSAAIVPRRTASVRSPSSGSRASAAVSKGHRFRSVKPACFNCGSGSTAIQATSRASSPGTAASCLITSSRSLSVLQPFDRTLAKSARTSAESTWRFLAHMLGDQCNAPRASPPAGGKGREPVEESLRTVTRYRRRHPARVGHSYLISLIPIALRLLEDRGMRIALPPAKCYAYL